MRSTRSATGTAARWVTWWIGGAIIAASVWWASGRGALGQTVEPPGQPAPPGIPVADAAPPPPPPSPPPAIGDASPQPPAAVPTDANAPPPPSVPGEASDGGPTLVTPTAAEPTTTDQTTTDQTTTDQTTTDQTSQQAAPSTEVPVNPYGPSERITAAPIATPPVQVPIGAAPPPAPPAPVGLYAAPATPYVSTGIEVHAGADVPTSDVVTTDVVTSDVQDLPMSPHGQGP